MKGLRDLVGAAGLAAIVALTAIAQPAVAAHGRLTSSTSNLAPGLDLTKIEDPSGPYSIRILTVTPSKPLTIDLTLAGNSLPGRARTSTMGSNAGALAAINGDFNVDPGTPLHNYLADGLPVMSGFQNGASFAISKDEATTYIQSARMDVDALNVTTGHHFNIVQYNHGDPAANEIDAYSKLGGTADKPPSSGCFVRMLRAGKLHWATGQQGLYKEYKVAAVKCQNKRMGFRKGTLILASRSTGAGATELQGLTHGMHVQVTWDMVGTTRWTDVMDSIGGMPVLVDNGTNVAKQTCSSYFCSRNPRTGIGYLADGTVVMVTVDGREPGVSIGMTLWGFANYMKGLGCVYALNLDGGGSTTMWVQGQGVVNHPSDSTGERYVTNAVLVLPGVDTTEVTPLVGTFGPSPAAPSEATSAALETADPGSTGGLLDAVANGAFGGSRSLPPDLQRTADTFAASH